MDYSDTQVETFLRTGQHEAELRHEFGDALYEELRLQARATPPLETLERVRQRVYILPGILGSKLSAVDEGVRDLVWIDPIDLAEGGVAKLKWTNSPGGVVASGVVQATYLRMKLTLRAAGFDVQYLPYDWRFAPAGTGRAIVKLFRKKGIHNVAIVAHSMGGLVAREIAAHDPDREIVSRIITLGTPNHGSYSPVRILILKHGTLSMLGRIDQHHTTREIVQKYLRDFPGLLQMLPAPALRPGENYFRADGYPSSAGKPLKRALDAALGALDSLPAPDARTVQIVGIGQETIRSARLADDELVFTLDHDGDGTVPRDLAEMGDVPRYYIEGEHGQLCNHGGAIRAVMDILERGATNELPETPPPSALEAVGPREMTETEIGARVEIAAERAGPPVETDFGGDFLGGAPASLGDDMGREQPPSGDIFRPGPVPPSGKRRAAYPIDIADDARRNWDRAEGSREHVQRMLREGTPLQAESSERLDKYAKRLLRHFESVPEARGSELADRLREAVQFMDAVERDDAIAPPAPQILLERVIGRAEEFLSVMFVKRAALALRSVGRVVDRAGGFGFGTGFLIAPNVLMTNNHVLRDAFDADGSAVEFLYELDVGSNEIMSQQFRLEPHKLFHTDRRLDLSIVAVAQSSAGNVDLSEFGYLPLVGVEGKIRKGQPVNIIQHPAGERKQVVFRESVLSDLPDDPDHVAHYTGDTKPGSSGSPVFSDKWEVVALHHAGVPGKDAQGNWLTLDGQPWDIRTDPDMNTVKWVSNEGIRISRIIRHLKQVPDELMTRGDAGSDLVVQALAVGEKALREGIFMPTAIQVPAPPPAPVPVSSPAPEPCDRSAAGPVELRGAHAGAGEAAVIRPTQPEAFSFEVPLTISLSIGGAAPVVLRTTGAAQDERQIGSLGDRPGFDPNFLGEPVEMPRPQNTIAGSVAQRLDGGGGELRYLHHSIIMNRTRRLAFVSAGNVRTDPPFRSSGDADWVFDPRLDAQSQAGSEFYGGNVLDRGHLFRRSEAAWGETQAEADAANGDTFYWTNCAPHHEVFNRSHRDADLSLWGLLENHVSEQAGSVPRFNVLNGPVFGVDDPIHRGLAIPRAFWKVVVMKPSGGTLTALGFVVGQETLLATLPAERFDPGRFGIFQVKLRDLETRTGLDFGALRERDTMERRGAEERFLARGAIIRLERPSDIVL